VYDYVNSVLFGDRSSIPDEGARLYFYLTEPTGQEIGVLFFRKKKKSKRKLEVTSRKTIPFDEFKRVCLLIDRYYRGYEPKDRLMRRYNLIDIDVDIYRICDEFKMITTAYDNFKSKVGFIRLYVGISNSLSEEAKRYLSFL